jgi:hypothetical protein
MNLLWLQQYTWPDLLRGRLEEGLVMQVFVEKPNDVQMS